MSRRWYTLTNDKVWHPAPHTLFAFRHKLTVAVPSIFFRFWILAQTLWRRMCLRKGWTRPGLADEALLSPVNLWKRLYAERTTLQTNWRRGRFDVMTFQQHQGIVHAVDLARTRLLTAGHDGKVLQWCARTGDLLSTCKDAASNSPVVAVERCGPFVLATRMNGYGNGQDDGAASPALRAEPGIYPIV